MYLFSIDFCYLKAWEIHAPILLCQVALIHGMMFPHLFYNPGLWLHLQQVLHWNPVPQGWRHDPQKWFCICFCKVFQGQHLPTAIFIEFLGFRVPITCGYYNFKPWVSGSRKRFSCFSFTPASHLTHTEISFLIISLFWCVNCFSVHLYKEGADFQNPCFIQGFYFKLSAYTRPASFLLYCRH